MMTVNFYRSFFNNSKILELIEENRQTICDKPETNAQVLTRLNILSYYFKFNDALEDNPISMIKSQLQIVCKFFDDYKIKPKNMILDNSLVVKAVILAQYTEPINSLPINSSKGDPYMYTIMCTFARLFNDRFARVNHPSLNIEEDYF